MLAVLPGVAWLLLLRALRGRIDGLRPRLLVTSLIWAATLVAITELLDLLHAVNRGGVICSWIVVILGAGILSLRRPLQSAAIKQQREDSGGAARVMGATVGVISVASLILALVAPPNTWDALTYHLPRVMHWIQNESLDHYPTHNLRQLFLSPGAEFMLLHFELLAGSDRFANMPQWLASIGSLICVSLIAARLGSGPRGQAFAALFCATIPMGVLQSTSAQNDYVAALWLACSAWLLLLEPDDSSGIGRGLLQGCAVGLALLAKATNFIFLPPIICVHVFWIVRRRAGFSWLKLLTTAAIAVAINAGHWSRNYRGFGNILGPPEETLTYRNAALTPGVLISNIERNIALHANIGIGPLLRAAHEGTLFFHRALGLDPNDPRSTYGVDEFTICPRWNHEDFAGCGPHILILVVAMCVILMQKRPGRAECAVVAACGISGFILFCAYLRWQPWHTRLHLPLIVLMAPLAGIASGRLRSNRGVVAIGLLLVIGASPQVFRNESRPLAGKGSVFTLSRNEALFVGDPAQQPVYESVASQMRRRNCRRVGLMLGADGLEYYLWALLNQRATGPYRFDHVQVTNSSRNFPHGLHVDPLAPDCMTPVLKEQKPRPGATAK